MKLDLKNKLLISAFFGFLLFLPTEASAHSCTERGPPDFILNVTTYAFVCAYAAMLAMPIPLTTYLLWIGKKPVPKKFVYFAIISYLFILALCERRYVSLLSNQQDGCDEVVLYFPSDIFAKLSACLIVALTFCAIYWSLRSIPPKHQTKTIIISIVLLVLGLISWDTGARFYFPPKFF